MKTEDTWTPLSIEVLRTLIEHAPLTVEQITERIAKRTGEPVRTQSVRNVVSHLREYQHVAAQRAEHKGTGWRKAYAATSSGRAAVANAKPWRKESLTRASRGDSTERARAARERFARVRYAFEVVTRARAPQRRHEVRQVIGIAGRLRPDEDDKHA